MSSARANFAEISARHTPRPPPRARRRSPSRPHAESGKSRRAAPVCIGCGKLRFAQPKKAVQSHATKGFYTVSTGFSTGLSRIFLQRLVFPFLELSPFSKRFSFHRKPKSAPFFEFSSHSAFSPLFSQAAPKRIFCGKSGNTPFFMKICVFFSSEAPFFVDSIPEIQQKAGRTSRPAFSFFLLLFHLS